MEHDSLEQAPLAELYDIVRGLRTRLARHRRAGVWAAPAGDTERPEDVDWRDAMTGNPAAMVGPGAEAQRARQPRDDTPMASAPRAVARADHGGGAGRAGHDDPDDSRRDHSQDIEEALGFSSMSAALAHALGESKPARATRAPAPPSQDPGVDARSVGPTTGAAADATPAPASVAAPSSQPARPTLATVRSDLGDCQRCKLAPARTHLVFGVGHEDADLMFIGEAPGEQEDVRGEPFVGNAGQLLDKMIAAMGWSRETVYIANVLKCRPPRNRDPEADEVAACRPFLERQIAAVQPRILVTLGKPAAHLVLGTSEPMWRLRGKFYSYQGIPVMPTYHPSHLLRHGDAKRDAWEDLKQVIAELERMGVRSPHPPRG